MDQPAKKILIVEDEKPMAMALVLKLNKSGFEAKAVFNGEEAIDIVAKEKFDLIILDLIIPKVDGFQVLAKLKEIGSHVPVIISSNLSQEEDFNRAKELGAVDFFVKSDTPITEVVEHIQRILDKS
jgi:two-component system alkaline phosphatase synthesis response regulator PhoP